jgi:hypothetical protein
MRPGQPSRRLLPNQICVTRRLFNLSWIKRKQSEKMENFNQIPITKEASGEVRNPFEVQGRKVSADFINFNEL